ncbi:MAG TPA: MFS transporter [Mycobacteriales bacterium]
MAIEDAPLTARPADRGPLASRTVPVAGGEARASRTALVLGVLFGLTATGSSAAAVVLPQLQEDLGLSHAAAAWTLSIYALMLAVTTAGYGRIADIVGVRKPLVAGVVLMAAGATISALATALPMLLVGRVVQGAGAGAVPVLATALISARFSGETRSGALGRVAGVSAAVSALGPLAGGVLDLVGGWRVVVALPIAGLVLLPAVARAAPARGGGGRLDLRGAVLVAGTAAGLVLLLQSAAAGPLLAGVGAGLLAAGIPLTALHVRRRPEGFLPRAVVTRGRVLRAALAGASIPAAWFALLLAVPADLHGRGWTPLQVGLALVPAAALGLLAARRAGWVLSRLGGRLTLGGSALLAAASLLTAALGVDVGSPLLLVLAVCVVTLSFSIGQPAMVSEVGSAVAGSVRGIALGVATLAFLAGGSVGSAAVGGLADLLGMSGALSAVTVLPFAAAAVAVLAGRRAARTSGTSAVDTRT